MTIEREDLELDEDEEKERVNGEREAEEAKERETARQKELEEERVARARAEGELEAFKRGVRTETPPPAQITEEQWQDMEARTGKTRQQIKADAEMMNGMFAQLSKPIVDRAEAAEREAREAKEEARRVKSGQSLYAIEREFYEKNPALTGRRGDVEEFLSMLPSEVKDDPKKYSDALEKAKLYVRGKAREDIQTRRNGKTTIRTTNTEREEFREEGESEEPELDLSDLDNEGARTLVSNIAKMPGGVDLQEAPPSLDEVSIDKAYAMSERKDKRGVSIDERGEWKRGEKRQRGETVLRTTEDERVRRSR